MRRCAGSRAAAGRGRRAPTSTPFGISTASPPRCSTCTRRAGGETAIRAVTFSISGRSDPAERVQRPGPLGGGVEGRRRSAPRAANRVSAGQAHRGRLVQVQHVELVLGEPAPGPGVGHRAERHPRHRPVVRHPRSPGRSLVTNSGTGVASAAGARTLHPVPEPRRSAAASPTTCACTPPGTSSEYGQTMPTRSAAGSRRAHRRRGRRSRSAAARASPRAPRRSARRTRRPSPGWPPGTSRAAGDRHRLGRSAPTSRPAVKPGKAGQQQRARSGAASRAGPAGNRAGSPNRATSIPVPVRSRSASRQTTPPARSRRVSARCAARPSSAATTSNPARGPVARRTAGTATPGAAAGPPW